MRLLLQNGADPDTRNVDDKAICQLASEDGQTEVVNLLLEYDVDINVKGTDLWAPLHYAARKGHKEVAELLLNHGADVNAKTMDGDTPLILASRYGHIELVRLLLLDFGADMGEDNTAFKCALMEGHKTIVNLLCSCYVHTPEGFGESTIVID
ncbi:ankyrin repeat-containing domain protein [Lactifluus volemus]|nr:ankyrin repeat-containing domain protein [Lactifluus volemus]